MSDILQKSALGLLGLVVLPPRWMRLLALLCAVAGVASLFYLGSKPFAGGLFSHPVDKLVHFIVYGGLAGLCWVLLGGKWRQADFGAVILAGFVGAADESVQRMIPTREASVADLLFDMLGIFVAVGLLAVARDWMLRSSNGSGKGQLSAGLKSIDEPSL